MTALELHGLTTLELHDALLACDSATAVLERFFASPITIRRIAAGETPPDPAQRARLQLDQATPWRHRRVELLSHGRVLSRAELWYVPGRLPEAMREALATTDIPFGRIVRDLQPRRTTISARICGPSEAAALDHSALLTIGEGASRTPIAEVREFYDIEAVGRS